MFCSTGTRNLHYVPPLRKIDTPLLALGTIDTPVRNEFCVNNYDLTLNYLVYLKEHRVFF
jgi:hypothetical protein